MEIIKKGFILEEEQEIEKQLKLLPDSWLCIGGDANRFILPNVNPFQIDFTIINPYGVFFIESKHVAKIGKDIQSSNIYFFNSKGQKILKHSKRANPVEEIMYLRYKIKDWFTNRGFEGFFSQDKKSIKVFFHGLVVLLNPNRINYQNINWEDISYTQNKNPSLISIMDLNINYFKSLKLPNMCNLLSYQEMWVLFQIFHNPDMNLIDLFSRMQLESNDFLNQKQIYLKKIEILEQENKDLSKQIKNIDSTKEYLLNQFEITKKNKLQLEEQETSLKEEKKNILNEYAQLEEKYESTSQNYQAILNENISLDEKLKKQEIKFKNLKNDLFILEKEKLRYTKVINQTNYISRFKYYIITFITMVLILSFMSFGYFYLQEKKNNLQNLALIEKFYFIIENWFQEKKYKKILNLWQNEILKNGEMNTNILKDYNMLFYYIALSYENQKDYQNAIKYQDIFLQVAKNPNEIVMAYYKKGLNYIQLKSGLDRAIFNLKKAAQLNKENLNSYPLNVHIPFNLGRAYEMVLSLNDMKKVEYKKLLATNNFFERALSSYKEALIKIKKTDFENEIQIQANIAHLYFVNKNYQKAIQEFNHLIKLIKSQNNINKYIEKELVAQNGLAVSYSFFKNFDLAEKYYYNAINLLDKFDMQLMHKKDYYRAQIFLNLGSMYLNQNRYNLALDFLRKAYNLAKNLNLSNLNRFLKKLKDAEILYENDKNK